jgi:Fe-S-cluster-containing hydrogenase component 2
LRRVWLAKDAVGLIHNVLSCQQCNYPGCYYACPRKNEALFIDSKTGSRCINPDKCQIGCHRCFEACLLVPPRINYDAERNIHLICDLCKDRTNGPACVEFCPAECLKLEETSEV